MNTGTPAIEDIDVGNVIGWIEGAALDSLEVHPLCEYVPPSESIAVRDRIEQPVVLLDGLLLDGRARVREARRLALPCPARAFSSAFDIHPAVLIASAAAARLPKAQRRAVTATLLVRAIECRHDWLAAHDQGMADRVRTATGRESFVVACGASYRHFQRAYVLTPELLHAVGQSRISLANAHRLRELNVLTQRRIVELPVAQQKLEIERAVTRIKDRNQTQWQITFETGVTTSPDFFLDAFRSLKG